MTVVRLRNLIERAPQMSDLQSVTALMVVCERFDVGMADPTPEDVLGTWQAPGFHLNTDAWVIATTKGQIVGYAEVRRDGQEGLVLLLHVHPDYRGRGIGTLLLWLAEERARHLLGDICSDGTVTLSAAVSCLNQAACQLFEWQGYQLARHFWRVLIGMEEACDACDQGRKLYMDLVVDTDDLLGTTPVPRRTGLYTARQYAVYRKTLRAGHDVQTAQLEARSVAV